MTLKISTTQQKVSDRYGDGYDTIFGKRCVKCKKKESECACDVPEKTQSTGRGIPDKMRVMP
jgi:hypothetical protein